MPTPTPPINTVEKIITDLNAEGKGAWVALDGYYCLTVPTLSGKVVNFSVIPAGVVLKAFFNLSTAEIRTYAAKFLDVPERENWF